MTAADMPAVRPLPFFFYLLLAFLAGVFVHPLPAEKEVFAAGAAGIVLLWMLHRLALRYKAAVYGFGLLALLSAGAAGSVYYYLRAPAGRRAPEQPAYRPYLVRFEVIDRLRPSKGRQRYRIRWFRDTAAGRSSVAGALLYTSDTLVPGRFYTAVLPAGAVRPLPRRAIPYGFDYARYWRHKGIGYRWLADSSVYMAPSKRINPWRYYPYRLRRRIERAFRQYLQPRNLSLAMALFLGQRQDLDPAVRQAFIDAGIMHILAISGLHIGILLLFLRGIFGPLRWRSKWLYHLLIIGMLFLYAWLTGFPPSVARATLMFALFQWAWEQERPVSSLYILALTAFVLVLIDPAMAGEVGFQLSFVAVASIILLFPLAKRLYYPRRKVLRYLVDLFYVSLAAQIGLMPLILLYFHRFSWGFLVANLAVIPLLTVILGVGFTAILLVAAGLPAGILLKGLDVLLQAMWQITYRISLWEGWIGRDIYFTPLYVWAWWLALAGIYVWWKGGRSARYYLAALLLTAAFWTWQWGRRQTTQRQHVVLTSAYGKPVLIRLKDRQWFLYADSVVPPAYFKAYRQEAGVRDSVRYLFPRFFRYGRISYRLVDRPVLVPGDTFRADVLILSGSPKLNLDIWLNRLRPRQVIFGPGNRVFLKKLWQKTLRQRGIPYRDLYDEGFVMLSDTLAPAGEP